MRRLPRIALLLGALFLTGCPAQSQLNAPSQALDAGNYAEAETALRGHIAQRPDDAEAHRLLGRALALQGKAREADVYLRRTVELDSKSASSVARERRELMAVFQTQAVAALDAEDPATATARLDDADLMQPDDPETVFLRGRVAEAEGRMDVALAAYRRAFRTTNRDAYRTTLLDALVESARQDVQARRFAFARDALSEARAIDNHVEYVYLEGSVYYAWAEASRGDEAIALRNQAAAAFEDVLRRRPDDEDAAYNLGAVLLASNRYADAARLYEDLVRRHPRDGELYQALSLAHGHVGLDQLARAEDAVGRALRAHEPVDDPVSWADRSARRFPGSDLAETYYDLGSPSEIYTYQRTGGGLVEVWFYPRAGVATAFRDGGRIGEPVPFAGR